VLQPKFLEQFPNACFHFSSGDGAQRGTFKGVTRSTPSGRWRRSSSKGTACQVKHRITPYKTVFIP
jgi:hypothetical protein